MIHNTLLAMLVTGSHVPPARLHTIKTALHPSAAQHLLCQDKDCLLKLSGCKGNRFEVHKSEGGGEVVTYIAPHHKNDRRGSNQVLTYDLPAGPLTELMLMHIKEGHGVLIRAYKHRQPHLFMSGSGLSFSDCLFAQWWHNFYHNTKGPLPYFPPSKGRTLFVESFISSTGHQPQESWEGAAMAMGNSVKQWKEFYAPRMKHRLAQEAVHKHQAWRHEVMGEQQEQGGEQGPARSSGFAHGGGASAHGPPPKKQAIKREEAVDEHGAMHRTARSSSMPGPVGVKAEPDAPSASLKRAVEHGTTTIHTKRVKVEQPSMPSCAPYSPRTPPYADEEEQEYEPPSHEPHAHGAWHGPCSPTSSFGYWGHGQQVGGDDEGMEWEEQLGDEVEVEITRVVPPGGGPPVFIDLTATSSDSEEE